MRSPTPRAEQENGAAESAPVAEPPKPTKKKFLNGWTREIEDLMAEWADKAACYRWMHETTERKFTRYNQYYTIPVIILSTLTGTANFGLDSLVPDESAKKFAQVTIGGVSLLTGIISTVANFLRYAQGSEAHRVAGISWGKFQRLIAIELSLHPDERSDCMHFLKMCRTELDRLIEQSPPIPTGVIKAFKKEFRNYPTVKKPEIAGEIDHTNVFRDTNSRLKFMAAEVAITLQHKKGVLKQMVLDDMEPRIQRVLEHSTLPAMKEDLKAEIRAMAEQATKDAVAAITAAKAPTTGTLKPTMSSSVQASAMARAEEVKRLATTGLVRAMKEKLVSANATIGETPVGISAAIGLPPGPPPENDIILHVPAEDVYADLVDEEVSEPTSISMNGEKK